MHHSGMTPEVSTAILRCARLGAVRRRLLIDAGLRQVQVTEGCATPYAAVVRRRAAQSLAALGLIDLFKTAGVNAWGSRCPGMLHATVTDLGRVVLAAFRHEIETGKPIRWARLKAHAAA